jgi:hypothetical protein
MSTIPSPVPVTAPVLSRRLKRATVSVSLLMGLVVLYRRVVQPTYSRWGATRDEVRRALPGDELIEKPVRVSTRALTIHAPVSAVWPWVVQIGQERGGLYSYESLENAIGCQISNADRIVQEWQHPRPGDRVGLGPEGYPFFTVVDVQPERAFVLRAGDETYTGASWVFALESIDATHTRLIVRMRSAASRNAVESFFNDLLTPPLHFVMEREMLHGIARRAEALAKEAAPVAM